VYNILNNNNIFLKYNSEKEKVKEKEKTKTKTTDSKSENSSTNNDEHKEIKPKEVCINNLI